MGIPDSRLPTRSDRSRGSPPAASAASSADTATATHSLLFCSATGLLAAAVIAQQHVMALGAGVALIVGEAYGILRAAALP